MKISELSKVTKVSQRMLRYFEQHGLLRPERKENDYRSYDRSDQKRILEIREWQRLGLTLKEIGELLNRPEAVDRILEDVFSRERENFLERQKALQDLRERFTGRKFAYFEDRIAYSIPNADKVVSEMATMGWKNTDFSYLRFCEWRDEVADDHFMIGEIIWQSSFYLLASKSADTAAVLEKLMADFCKAANRQWPTFDGNPPKKIECEDLGEFFAPNDIIASLSFESPGKENIEIVLPYQSVFALAKSASRRGDE
jgi:DNA-binding transcriptional MerR regulator